MQSISRAIEAVNQARPKAQRLEQSRQTALIGEGTVLDSLGLINLVVAIEGELAEEFSIDEMSIADEQARLQPQNPFGTVGSLADFLAARLRNEAHG